MAFSLDLGNLVVHLRLDNAQFTRMMGQAQVHLKSAEQSMTRLGRQMTMGLTLPILGVGVAAVKSFSTLEDAFIGVQKTVNATEAELQGLKKGFEDMSRSIPIATAELFGIGEAAGQLGIKTENILAFSETMAQLGVATNLSAEEAASSLARLANITGMSQDNFDRMGATIVELGNNLATTEAEIVGMSLRLAGAGSQVGLTEAQILSLAGALSSVGLRAEQGGTAFSRIMLEMNTAVKNNTKELRSFALASGTTQEEFVKLFNRDAQDAIESFVKGLADLRDRGRDVTPILEGIGLGGIRVIDVLGRMSGASDILTQSFDMGAKAWEDATALSEEARKKFVSFSSQLQITKNHLILAAASIADFLVPHLEKLQTIIQDGLRFWEGFSVETRRMAVNFALMAAAAGPALLIMAQGTKAIRGLLRVMVGLRAVLLGMVLPFGGIIAAIGVIIGLAYTLRAAWNQGVEGVRENLEALKGYFADSLEFIRNTAIGQFLESSIKAFAEFFKSLAGGFGNLSKNVTGILNVLRKDMMRGLKGIPAQQNQWAIDFVEGMEWAEGASDSFAKHVDQNFAIARESIKKFTFNRQGDSIEDIPTLLQGVFPALRERLGQVTGALKKQLQEDFGDLFAGLKIKIDTAETLEEMRNVLDEFESAVAEMTEATDMVLEDSKDKTVSLLEDMTTKTTEGIRKIKATLLELFTEGTTKGEEFMSSMTSSIQSGLMAMTKDFDNFGDHVKKIFQEIYFEAIRIAFITPLAQETASLFMTVGASILGGGTTGAGATAISGLTGTGPQPTIGSAAPIRYDTSFLNTLTTSPSLPLPSRHSGQNLAPDELVAVIKRDETIAPKEKTIDGTHFQGQGGSVEFNLVNQSGTPLNIRKTNTQQIDRRQIVTVILDALDNDMMLKRKTKLVANT